MDAKRKAKIVIRFDNVQQIILLELKGEPVVSSNVTDRFRKQHKLVLDSICSFQMQMSTAEFSALFRSAEIETKISRANDICNEKYISYVSKNSDELEEYATKIMNNWDNNIKDRINIDARLPIEGIHY